MSWSWESHGSPPDCPGQAYPGTGWLPGRRLLFVPRCISSAALLSGMPWATRRPIASFGSSLRRAANSQLFHTGATRDQWFRTAVAEVRRSTSPQTTSRGSAATSKGSRATQSWRSSSSRACWRPPGTRPIHRSPSRPGRPFQPARKPGELPWHWSSASSPPTVATCRQSFPVPLRARLSPRQAPALRVECLREPGEYLVRLPNGKPFDACRFWRTAWKKALRDAGLPHRRPYATRHSFASWSLILGVNPTRLVSLMGHGSKQMVYGKRPMNPIFP